MSLDSQDQKNNPYVYKFSEFLKHREDILGRHYEISDGQVDTFLRNLERVNNYFYEFYDSEFLSFISSRFIVMMKHVTDYANNYSVEPFGGKIDDKYFVTEDLLRGVHWHYTQRDRAEWGSNDQSCEDIKLWVVDYISKK